jgi:acyl-CoA reductase-like NAD-dependent aldehyde dehydrogenase
MRQGVDHAMTQTVEQPVQTGKALLRIRNYIGGEWCEALSGEIEERRNPANTEQVVGCFPATTRADAQRAIEAANRAFPNWRKTPAPQRARILKRALAIMEANLERFARDLTLEQGKPLREARAEIVRALEEADFVVGEGSRVEGQRLASARPGAVCYTTREPLGVISAIIPWNYPFIAAMRKVAPGLVFGNTIVLKPAEWTPFSGANLVTSFAEAGLPPGALNFVTGPGPTVGAELAENTLVRGISFTGSTAVGKNIAKAAAENNAKVQLELGGKNPAVIFEGTDLNKAATEIVTAALLCSGQRCTSISRVIVQKSLAQDLAELLKVEMDKIVVGDGFEDQTTMGPLVSEAHLQRVLAYVQKGIEEGATLARGGQRLTGSRYDKGFFMEPTLFTDVKPVFTLAREEVFGPVLSVIEFKDIDEALDIANSVAYGLAACAYTPRIDQALAFVDRIQAGMTQVNMPTYCDPHAPFGGVKASGQGAFSVGHSNIEFFTNLKSVYLQG